MCNIYFLYTFSHLFNLLWRSEEASNKAFEILSVNEKVDYDTWRCVVVAMRPHLQEVTQFLFQSIDTDGDGLVNRSEFYELVLVLNVTMKKKEVNPATPITGCRSVVYKIVTSPWFDAIVDLVVLINALRFLDITVWDQLSSLTPLDYFIAVFFVSYVAL